LELIPIFCAPYVELNKRLGVRKTIHMYNGIFFWFRIP